jgi:hypothetical protein
MAIVIAGNAAWTLASVALLFSGAITPNLLSVSIVALDCFVALLLAMTTTTGDVA